MKYLLIIVLTFLLTACGSTRNTSVTGVLVETFEFIPNTINPCKVITILIVQTANSGRSEIKIYNSYASNFKNYIGKNIELDVSDKNFIGCEKTKFYIKEIR